MMEHYILDENREPIEIEVWRDATPEELERGEHTIGGKALDAEAMMRWSQWFETNDRHVAKTDIGPYWISTVFLGLNHEWDEDRAPLLFETMVFDNEHKVKCFGRDVSTEADLGDGGIQWRYPTWQEAERGHAEAVKRCQFELDRASQEVESGPLTTKPVK